MSFDSGRAGQKPVFLKDGTRKVAFRKYDKAQLNLAEEWYQHLIEQHPYLLLTDKFGIESEPISIGTEYETTHGKYIDNLFITRDGNIILVEDKLFRNESSRRVISQVIDYAQDLQKWSYEDLDKQFLRQKCNTEKVGLFEYVNRYSGGSVDRVYFEQAIEKTLRTATFLILIVGDKIHADTENMAAFLNQHTTMNIQIGLIEIEIYISEDNDWVVIPYLTTNTRTIEKTYVRVMNQNGSDEMIEELNSTQSETYEIGKKLQTKPKSTTEMLSDEALYSAIERNESPETRQGIQTIIDDIRNSQLERFFIKRRSKSFCVYFQHAKLVRPLALMTISDTDIRFDQNVFRAVFSDSEIDSDTTESLLSSYVDYLNHQLGLSGDKEIRAKSSADLARNKGAYFNELNRLAERIDAAMAAI